MASDNDQPSSLWLLAYDVSIVDAALLTISVEPQGVSDYIEGWEAPQLPPGYLAAKEAITSAIKRGEIAGRLCDVVYNTPGSGWETDHGRTDYSSSRVELMSLREWLRDRGYWNTFLQIDDFSKPAGFRDKNHPRYAPKLAAVVEAWEAFDESSSRPGTPKQRLMIWLRLNASRFGLVNDEGAPSENVIDELAKVANWATTGGAPKSKIEEPAPVSIDDEIPF